MSAYFTAHGLGLLDSSILQLGNNGSFGQANIGQDNESHFINVATGNLVLRNQDEILVGQGVDTNVFKNLQQLRAVY